MKYLGVDPGDARIGLAISDEQGILARPLTILKHVSRPENARRIIEIAEREECAAIVVGIPYDSDGGVGPRARASLKLIDAIRVQCELDILSWDESGSSKASEEALINLVSKKRRSQEHHDDFAAMLILTDFLRNQSDMAGRHE